MLIHKESFPMKNLGKILEGQIFQTMIPVIGVGVFVTMIEEHQTINSDLLILAMLSSLAHQLWVVFLRRPPVKSY